MRACRDPSAERRRAFAGTRAPRGAEGRIPRSLREGFRRRPDQRGAGATLYLPAALICALAHPSRRSRDGLYHRRYLDLRAGGPAAQGHRGRPSGISRAERRPSRPEQWRCSGETVRRAHQAEGQAGDDGSAGALEHRPEKLRDFGQDDASESSNTVEPLLRLPSCIDPERPGERGGAPVEDRVAEGKLYRQRFRAETSQQRERGHDQGKHRYEAKREALHEEPDQGPGGPQRQVDRGQDRIDPEAERKFGRIGAEAFDRVGQQHDTAKSEEIGGKPHAPDQQRKAVNLDFLLDRGAIAGFYWGLRLFAQCRYSSACTGPNLTPRKPDRQRIASFAPSLATGFDCQ